MSHIPNIKIHGPSVLTGSTNSVDDPASDDTKKQNSTDFAKLDGLRNKLNTAQTADHKTHSHQSSGELKNVSSVEAVKRLVQMISNLVQKINEFINVSTQGHTGRKGIKLEPEQMTKKVQGTQEGSIDGFNQNSLLFNQKPDSSINT